MPETESGEVDGQYIAEIQYATSREIFEFDPNRPAKNVDVLKYVISRTKFRTLNITRNKAFDLAGAAIVKLWLSFGAKMEDFRAQPTISSNIATICNNYRDYIKRGALSHGARKK